MRSVEVGRKINTRSPTADEGELLSFLSVSSENSLTMNTDDRLDTLRTALAGVFETLQVPHQSHAFVRACTYAAYDILYITNRLKGTLDEATVATLNENLEKKRAELQSYNNPQIIPSSNPDKAKLLGYVSTILELLSDESV